MEKDHLLLFMGILSLVNTCSILNKLTFFHFIFLRTNKSYLPTDSNLIIGLSEGEHAISNTLCLTVPNVKQFCIFPIRRLKKGSGVNQNIIKWIK